jgi:hypothetical protein
MTTDVGSFKSYQLSEGRTTPVSARVSPTDRIRGEIDALFDGSRELSEFIEDVARLGARLIIQTAVEAEVDVFLGRARYQRAATVPDARAGSRNGFCDSTIKTTAGPVTVARPKLRGTTEAFASQLFGTSVTRSNALESLVIAGFVRGLSVRDVESTLADALGAEAALSKSTVSRVCQVITAEFTAWSERRLDDLELDYLFLDASMFKMHPGARAEPVLAARGITTTGSPVFVALAAGGSESTDAWGERDGDDLAALTQHGQGAVTAFQAELVDVAAEGFGDPQAVDRQQTDQRVLGGGAQSGRDQQRADLVAVQPDRVRLVIQSWPAHMRGRRVLEPVLLDGVPVKPGDGAQPPSDRSSRPACRFHVAAEALDIRPAGGEQVQPVLGTPGRVLTQIQGVRVSGQPAVAGQKPGQRRPFISGEQRLGRHQDRRPARPGGGHRDLSSPATPDRHQLDSQ